MCRGSRAKACRKRHDTRPSGGHKDFRYTEKAATATAQLFPLVAAIAAVKALSYISRQLNVCQLVFSDWDKVSLQMGSIAVSPSQVGTIAVSQSQECG